MKYKKYSHFDNVMTLKEANNYIKNLDNHQYLPFITYKKDKNKWDEDHVKLKENRIISIASIKDNYVYQYYNEILGNKYEEYITNTVLDDCVCANRREKHKCNIDFFAEVYHFLKKSKKAKVFVGDIYHFYDNLDHKILKEKLKTILGTKELDENTYKMLKSIEKASYIELEDIIKFLNKKGIYIKSNKNLNHQQTLDYKDVCEYCESHNIKTIVKQEWFKELKETYLKPTKEDLKNKTKGIVQGASVSGTLSNIYMIDADRKINELLANYKYIYRRYVDDFILVIRNIDDEQYQKIINEIKNIIAEYKLELKDSKIQEFEYNHGIITGKKAFIQFLGFEIYNHNTVKIRQSTIDRWQHKLLKSKKVYLILKEYTKESELAELLKTYREINYHKLENIRSRNYRKRTIGTYISKANNKFDIKETKKRMADEIDKHIN